MTAEVKVEETQAAEVAVSLEEPTKGVEEAKVVEEIDAKAKPEMVSKSSSYREESNYFSDLKEHERKALIELKLKLEEAILANNLFKKEEKKEEEKESKEDEEKCEEPAKEDTDEKEQNEEKCIEIEKETTIWGVPLLPSKGLESTDVVLLKFLRAREFKVNEAFEMLKKTLQWRKDSKIDSILDEDLGVDLSSIAYMNGVDREGHPVCYNIFGGFENEELYKNTFSSEEKRGHFLRWRFQLMEKGIQKLSFAQGGVTSLLQINDLKNSPGPSKKELRVTTKQAIALLQDNYPEFVARNIFINVPFWYYAFYSIVSPFLTQRTKSKFVLARPAKVTETLLKYIPAEEIPAQYGGFKRDDDFEFCAQDSGVSELIVKAGSTATIEIPTPEVGATFLWDLTVLGWEVNYTEEFVPSDEGTYTIIVQKCRKMGSSEGPIRNSFTIPEPGKLVLGIVNGSSKKKKILYRYKTKKNSSY